jgi:hypothetical protein
MPPPSCVRVDLEFGFYGLGLRVWGLGFPIVSQNLGFGVSLHPNVGFRVWDLGFGSHNAQARSYNLGATGTREMEIRRTRKTKCETRNRRGHDLRDGTARFKKGTRHRGHDLRDGTARRDQADKHSTKDMPPV